MRDHVRSAYDVAPERAHRSVHPKLVRLGFVRRAATDPYQTRDMNFDPLEDLVSRWNADGRMPKDSLERIEVLRDLPEIACAKLEAQWGVDWFHLRMDDGKWRIRQVLWQVHPGEPGAVHELADEDRDAIRKAGLGYVDAFYRTEPKLLDANLHESVAKFGFYRPDGAPASTGMPMSRRQLADLARTALAGRDDASGLVKEVRILGALDATAAIEIVADWGIDFAHVAKIDDGWKLVHVLWQSHPPTAGAAKRGS